MKDVFLVHISLPDAFSWEFYELIPKQYELISALLERRVVLNYSMDIERKNIWAFFEASNREELMDILGTFPIMDDVKVNVQDLAFYNAAPLPMKEPILN